MNNTNIISNLKKDHFRITERYGKFILREEYDTLERGKTVSIENIFNPLSVSWVHRFVEESKQICDSFTEFVNEFFTYSDPEKYADVSDMVTKFIEDSREFSSGILAPLSSISVEDANSVLSILDEYEKCVHKFTDSFSRLNKYMKIIIEISKLNQEKDEMTFLDIVVGTTAIMNGLSNVVDEYTLNSFTTDQLLKIKEACMLQISSSKHLVEIGVLLDPSKEDEQKIRSLMDSTMRLVMSVRQIDLLIMTK